MPGELHPFSGLSRPQAGDSRLLSDEQEVAEFVSILICR